MSTLNDIRQTFFQECEELLEALDDGLELLRDALDDGQSEDIETINAVFRSVHSIKGGAAAFGLEQLVRFAHRFETTLDDLRAQRLPLTSDVLEVCLRAADQLAELVGAGRDGIELAPDAGAQVIEKLIQLSGGDEPSEARSGSQPNDDTAEYAPLPLSFDPVPFGDLADAPAPGLSFRFTAQPKLFANGHDPVHLFRELTDMGHLTVCVDPQTVPELDAIAPDACTMTWRVMLDTQATDAAVWEVFDFVEGLCDISVDASAMPAMPEVEGAPAYVPVPLDLSTTTEAPAIDKPVMLAAMPASEPARPATPAPTDAKPVAAAPKATVRVDLDHVDRLINIVGELVINQAVLTQCIKAAESR